MCGAPYSNGAPVEVYRASSNSGQFNIRSNRNAD
jgi:hypothetical protein